MENRPMLSRRWVRMDRTGAFRRLKWEETFLEELDINRRTSLLEPIFSNSFGIYAHETVCVINVQELKAVLTENEVLVLGYLPDYFSDRLGEMIQKLNQDNGHQGELPFGLQVIGIALDYGYTVFNTELSDIEKGVNIDALHKDLRIKSRKLHRLLARVQTVRDACHGLANNSKYQYVLGDYCSVYDKMLQNITVVQDSLDDCEFSIHAREEGIRNKQENKKMDLAIVTLVLTLASVITGVFGMNVNCPFCDDDWVLWVVLLVLIFGSIVGYVGLRKKLGV